MHPVVAKKKGGAEKATQPSLLVSRSSTIYSTHIRYQQVGAHLGIDGRCGEEFYRNAILCTTPKIVI